MNNYYLLTTFGFQLSIINDLTTKIYIHIEQNIIGKRYVFLIKIDRNSIISLTINNVRKFHLRAIRIISMQNHTTSPPMH